MSDNRPARNIVSIKGRFLIGIILLATIISLVGSYFQQVQAIDYPRLSNRSLTLGDTTPSATTEYLFSWAYPANVNVGSIRLLMCADAAIGETCTSPGGDFSGAVLDSQSGATGFGILSQTANEIILSRPPVVANTAQNSYDINDVVNPVGLPQKFFVRIQIYASTDGTGSFSYASSVVNATTNPIQISSVVPPILYFCVGLSLDEWCENVSGSQINYGDLSPILGDYAESKFGVATNATGGYVVTINGNTMSSGTRTIPELATPTAFAAGVPQFGLNLRANTVPAIGQDVIGDGIGTVSLNYDSPDTFQFVDGDVVAGAVTGSMFNTFTVSYIVNIPPDQPSGIYNTTVAYICTAAF